MERSRFEQILIRRANRRAFLLGGAGAGLGVAVSLAGRPTRARGAFQSTPVASPTTATGVFTLGVASGHPTPDGVVLWTRLAPDPIAEDGLGGMDPAPVEVTWEVASDEAFGQIVRSGTTLARPELGHTVHVDLARLEPASEFFYRFMAGSEVSPVGRTKTAAAAGTALDKFRFAFASCQHYESGFYTAYADMATQDLDLVVHLGDYIYEGPDRGEEAISEGTIVRRHTGDEIMTLADYRNRYALYRTDPNLQAAHAAFPWSVTWDDHEVDNNYAAEFSQDGDPVPAFLERRAAAYQAYYEHMPLRPEALPVGPDMQLYRRLTFGNLAEISVLDLRQYRSDHPCGDDTQVRCALALDPSTTMTGPDQERWLLEGLDASTATWNVLAQQVMMGQLDLTPGTAAIYAGDLWDGYAGARNRILSHLMSRGTSNPVVITGDIHSSWVNDLKADFADPASATIATEFVGTSITSGGDPDPDPEADAASAAEAEALAAENPHIRFYEGAHRGYVLCELTPGQWRSDYRFAGAVTTPDAPVETAVSFVVEAGRPGAQPA